MNYRPKLCKFEDFWITEQNSVSLKNMELKTKTLLNWKWRNWKHVALFGPGWDVYVSYSKPRYRLMNYRVYYSLPHSLKHVPNLLIWRQNLRQGVPINRFKLVPLKATPDWIYYYYIFLAKSWENIKNNAYSSWKKV